VDLSEEVEFDLWLRYVDALPTVFANTPPTVGIGDYFDMDVRVAWELREGVKLALVGQNLLHRDRFETGPDIVGTQPTQTQRGVYAKVTWTY